MIVAIKDDCCRISVECPDHQDYVILMICSEILYTCVRVQPAGVRYSNEMANQGGLKRYTPGFKQPVRAEVYQAAWNWAGTCSDS